MPMIPVKTGRLFGVATNAIIVKAPLPMPADPAPEIARPTINALEFGATPQIKLPISKMKTEIRKDIFKG
jgi:hypothetical protein